MKNTKLLIALLSAALVLTSCKAGLRNPFRSSSVSEKEVSLSSEDVVSEYASDEEQTVESLNESKEGESSESETSSFSEIESFEDIFLPEESDGSAEEAKKIASDKLSHVYASIAMDLCSYGYEVFNAYVPLEGGNEYGIGFTDNEELVEFENDEKRYITSGFLPFSEGVEIPEESLLCLQPMNFDGQPILDDSYSYLLGYTEEGIPPSHFVLNDEYVKYSVNGSHVNVETFENSPENYDATLGKLYSYDREETIFVPFDEIASEPIDFVPLTEEVDYSKLRQTLYDLIDEQNKQGFLVQSVTISFLSVDVLNALRGVLSQTNTLNGYSFEELDSIEFDQNRQYLYFNEDGSITLKDLPPIPVTSTKSFFDWLIDAIVLVGVGALAVVSIVYLGPVGAKIASGLIGAGIEYFHETFIEGKTFSEVNWAKVAVMGVCGTLISCIPCGAGALGYFAAGAIGGLRGAAMAALDGKGYKDVLISAGASAVFAMISHGLFSSCFPAGTEVLAADGYRPIESIVAGDYVASYNVYADKFEYQKVLETYENEASVLTRIRLSSGDSIISTPTHPYYVSSKNLYVPAEGLEKNDRLFCPDGEVYVIETEDLVLDEPVPVYNLHVEGNNNYFVDDSTLLVHNSCKHQDYEWVKTRKNFWRQEAVAQRYGGTVYTLNEDNILLMSSGKAPLDSFGNRIQLHHIDGISNSMENIVPLSQADHAAFHQAYGYIGFTAEDLYEFLKSIGLFDIFF